MDSNFDYRRSLFDTLNNNMRFSQTEDGMYGLSFFKGNTKVAELKFHSDSSLFSVYAYLKSGLLIQAHYDSSVFIVTNLEINKHLDPLSIRYLQEIGIEDKDTSIDLDVVTKDRYFHQRYEYGNYYYSFSIRTNYDTYISYEVNKSNELISKTLMKRISTLNLSIEERNKLLAGTYLNDLFVPVKKIYYKNGRKVKREKFKYGKHKDE